MLALGRAEAPPAVFAAIFDRLLLPKWKAETPRGASLIAFLDGADNWELRDFSSAALAAHRFDALLAVAGREVVDRLARGLDRSRDPLREAIRLAEFVDAAAGTVFLRQMADVVSREFRRCRAASDARGTTLYGLLAARLSVDTIAQVHRAGARLGLPDDSSGYDGAVAAGRRGRQAHACHLHVRPRPAAV